jgi:pimeloyl-ACP methyl ester carboxylesterase
MFLVLVGATYQGVATALERREFPHPGRLVDVGGHQLHIHCTGSGSPLVVLEAPATGLSVAWGWVQPAVARATRACSYDRAGLGWSESDGGFDPARVPEQLHTLLQQAGEPGPRVIAGQGLGAAFARAYAARYASSTAAAVLIDPPEPSPERRGITLMDASPWLARVGVLRLTRTLSRRAWGLPGSSGGAMRAFLNRPDHLTRAAREIDAWNAAVELAGETNAGGAVRLTVVSTAAGAERTALLTGMEEAERVTAAILAAVDAVRGAPP